MQNISCIASIERLKDLFSGTMLVPTNTSLLRCVSVRCHRCA